MNIHNFPPSWQQKRSGSRCDKLVKITLFGICLLNMVVRSTSGSNMPKFWVCLGTVDLYRIYVNKSILEGQTYQVSWFCSTTRGFYFNLMVSLWGTKISPDIQVDGVQFPWIFSFVPCKIDFFNSFLHCQQICRFFFPNILFFVVDLQVFSLLGLRGLLFSLENLLCCC